MLPCRFESSVRPRYEVISLSSPRPVWPIWVMPATSLVKRTQRVQLMQRVMWVSTSGPRFSSSLARLGSR